jgi:hypothetical protein
MPPRVGAAQGWQLVSSDEAATDAAAAAVRPPSRHAFVAREACLTFDAGAARGRALTAPLPAVTPRAAPQGVVGRAAQPPAHAQPSGALPRARTPRQRSRFLTATAAFRHNHLSRRRCPTVTRAPLALFSHAAPAPPRVHMH